MHGRTSRSSSSRAQHEKEPPVSILMEKENNASSATTCIQNRKPDVAESLGNSISIRTNHDHQAGAESTRKAMTQVSSPQNSAALLHTNHLIRSGAGKDTIEPVQAVTPQDHGGRTCIQSLALLNQNNNMDSSSSSHSSSSAGIDNDIKVPSLHRISRGKAEQKYDMNLVPKVKRNPVFLQRWRQVRQMPMVSSLPNLVPCDTASCDASAGDASADSKSTTSENSLRPSSEQIQDHCMPTIPSKTSNIQDNNMAYVPSIVTPFAEDCESCIWAPRSRAEWEDCIDELVNVCTAAAWHRERSNHKKKKEFSPPISQIYVKDRIDIDDPLRGYQIRHKTGGWLQGFVMMTNFTTWTHYFKWDLSHAMNGIDQKTYPGVVDDGSLTKDLESQPRSGDPHGTGVVWPTLAEISLVGGLGCGEYLLQMALDDIERRGSYEFVVLEATNTSRPFYEKFGFVRVGAVCKYGKQEDFVGDANSVEITGYRHWTYANESKARLNEHGGPSWMMARRIKKRDATMANNHCQGCGRDSRSFLDQLSTYFVSKKPEIKPLGTSGNRKRARAASTGNLAFSSYGQPTKVAKVAKDPAKTTLSGRQSKTPNKLEEIPESLLAPRPKSKGAARSSRTSVGATLVLPSKGPSAKGSNKSKPKTILKKQKIANMYRDPNKVYYYNKVVTPNISNTKASSFKSRYYFVLNFDENDKSIRLIPLQRRGTFKGKREGREKWKAVILPRNNTPEKIWLESMDVITMPASKWDIVPSYMVTKCSSVGDESWDILLK